MGYKRPTPKHLAAKLLAIRKNFGLSQRKMATLLQAVDHKRLSEFERGRRVPSLRVLIYYSRLAGIPMEFIVDDDTDLEYFKYYLTVVEERRRQKQRQEPPEQRVTLYWRRS